MQPETNKEIRRNKTNVRKHLITTGLFIFLSCLLILNSLSAKTKTLISSFLEKNRVFDD
jgi:hypothetical protein